MKTLITFLIIAFTLNPVRSQSYDYQEIFGADWVKAQQYESENRVWMEPLLTKNHIAYPLAIAVIFPELIRYSALRDKMEITLLKTLYINLGEEYANFSIGKFQMKPSFAEMIRVQAPEIMTGRTGIVFKDLSEYDDITYYRKSIVEDLEDPVTELNYLVAFLKICDKKYKMNQKDEYSKVKFLATAYNYGIDKTGSQIESMTNRKFFNTKLFSSEDYSYADVSLFWYKQYTSEK